MGGGETHEDKIDVADDVGVAVVDGKVDKTRP
jgi:hypothetical protein